MNCIVRTGLVLVLAMPFGASAAVVEINTASVIATECVICGSSNNDYFALGQTFRLDTGTSQVSVVDSMASDRYNTARLYFDDLGTQVAVDSEPAGAFGSSPVSKALTRGSFYMALSDGPMGAWYSSSFPHDTLSWNGEGFLEDLEKAPKGAILTYEAAWQSFDADFPVFVSPGIGPNSDSLRSSLISVTILETSIPAAIPLPLSGVFLATGIVGLVVAGRSARRRRG